MSVTLSLFAGVGAQFLDNNGAILSGGLIYTYTAGTTTPLTTYTTNLGTVAQPNPIVLDSAGRIPGGELWLTTGYGYKFVTKDSNGVLIGTYDNVPSSAQPPITNDASNIAYEQGAPTTAGSFVIGDTYLITSIGTTNFQTIGAVSNTVGVHFIATGIGSGTGTAQFSRTVQSKLQDVISVKDFGAVGDGITDDTFAIQSAINAILAFPNAGGKLYIPHGNYLISGSGLSIDPGTTNCSVSIFGDSGRLTSYLRYSGTGTALTSINNGSFIFSSLYIITPNSTAQIGIQFKSSSAGSNSGNGFIQNIGVENFRDTGFKIGNAADEASSEITFQNCGCNSCNNGWMIEGINSLNVSIKKCGWASDTADSGSAIVANSTNGNLILSVDGFSVGHFTTGATSPVIDLKYPGFYYFNNIYVEATNKYFIRSGHETLSLNIIIPTQVTINSCVYLDVTSSVPDKYYQPGSYTLTNSRSNSVELGGTGYTRKSSFSASNTILGFVPNVPISYLAGCQNIWAVKLFGVNLNPGNTDLFLPNQEIIYDKDGVEHIVISDNFTSNDSTDYGDLVSTIDIKNADYTLTAFEGASKGLYVYSTIPRTSTKKVIIRNETRVFSIINRNFDGQSIDITTNVAGSTTITLPDMTATTILCDKFGRVFPVAANVTVV